jgi:hypothetical protein
MMRRLVVLVTFLTVAALAMPAVAQNQFILRIEPGVDISDVCVQYGLDLLGALDGNRHDTFVVSSSDYMTSEDTLEMLSGEKDVIEIEPVISATVPESSPETGPSLAQSTVSVLDGLGKQKAEDYFGSKVWKGYLEQPATSIIGLDHVLRKYSPKVNRIVAIIDTGVDPDHNALEGVLLPGFDFTRDWDGTASEWYDLSPEIGQSTVSVLDGSNLAKPNQSTVAVLDEEFAEFLNNPAFVAFGHGTMVAGIVHLVAPEALILPLKAFRADGTATTSNIVRAIYYAVEHGASVINMSFSLSQFSPALLRAVNYAAQRGVICVASVGNNGDDALVYPAALGNAIGVASTTDTDERASFSNYGTDLVRLSAPGEGIITTYPGSTYAAVWGTSFSAGLVSGAAAVLLDMADKPLPSAIKKEEKDGPRLRFVAPLIAEAMSFGGRVDEGLGFSRLDLSQAANAIEKKLIPATRR